MKPFGDRGEAGREVSRSRTLLIGDLFGGDGDGEGDGRRFSFDCLVLSIFFFFRDLLKKLGRTIEMTEGVEIAQTVGKLMSGYASCRYFLNRTKQSSLSIISILRTDRAAK